MKKIKIDFNREKEWWNAKAHKEENDLADESINRALRWREINKHLKGVKTILEIGAATGVFSIPLAKRGFKVTHVDFSPEMLDVAKRKAKGIKNITFIEANSTNLSRFPNRSFDLVLNMDGAISFSGSEASVAIKESCRVTKRTLILTVSNLAKMIALWVDSSLEVSNKFMGAVQAMFDQGLWHQKMFRDNYLLTKGSSQDYVGALKAYSSNKLRKELEKNHLRVARVGGLGSLASLCGVETIQKVMKNKKLFNEFIELCDKFDKEIMPEGPGTKQRAGLIAVAKVIK
ncbi:MAG: class I SAM-dependent methyltransferase [Candidatus Magasanikiibacteriota bacterium]